MIIKAYTTSSGRSPVYEFIDDLPKKQRQDFLRTLEVVKAFGLEAPGVSMRKIKRKLWEIRISQSRTFYVFIDIESMVLLSAYKKQSQKTPDKEIDIATKRMKEILE